MGFVPISFRARKRFGQHFLADQGVIANILAAVSVRPGEHIAEIGPGEGVNVTLGLPIIRTSVDHGTALDLAGSGAIETGSMKAAIHLAIDLAHTHAVTAR